MTESIRIVGQAPQHPVATIDYPRPDRLVQGQPQRLTYPYYDHPNMSCGVWTCEIGAWRIAFAPNKQEFFHVLAGRIRIQPDHGVSHTFSAGEAGVIPPNFTGVFEVLEPVRKYYVVVEVAPTVLERLA
ncbi:cupin domain-containing protein [Parvibium lacunae]|uniref:DUF861 domain-containing protein n=1 Tax=Parvibium lacunae TaxID=1888893 RepID=A0A368L078_9BURK|nr:cupin domain-containing protein [Parvibium lacunae]RCS56794.1 DUF861 domain-containing protein [Parvibium lacunae]